MQILSKHHDHHHHHHHHPSTHRTHRVLMNCHTCNKKVYFTTMRSLNVVFVALLAVLVLSVLTLLAVAAGKKLVTQADTPSIVGKLASAVGEQCALGGCIAGLECDPMSQSCRKPLGAPCMNYSECLTGCTCSGRCTRNHAANLLGGPCPCWGRNRCTWDASSEYFVCKAKGGEKCRRSSECASSLCAHGRCSQRLHLGHACSGKDDCISRFCSGGFCQMEDKATGTAGAACALQPHSNMAQGNPPPWCACSRLVTRNSTASVQREPRDPAPCATAGLTDALANWHVSSCSPWNPACLPWSWHSARVPCPSLTHWPACLADHAPRDTLGPPVGAGCCSNSECASRLCTGQGVVEKYGGGALGPSRVAQIPFTTTAIRLAVTITATGKEVVVVLTSRAAVLAMVPGVTEEWQTLIPAGSNVVDMDTTSTGNVYCLRKLRSRSYVISMMNAREKLTAIWSAIREIGAHVCVGLACFESGSFVVVTNMGTSLRVSTSGKCWTLQAANRAELPGPSQTRTGRTSWYTRTRLATCM